jgi:hypothetical protein
MNKNLYKSSSDIILTEYDKYNDFKKYNVSD